MTFPEYWAALVAKNPLLATEQRLTVSPDKIKAMIAEAHAEGFEHGKQIGAALVDKLFR